jgi:hypothetical protein
MEHGRTIRPSSVICLYLLAAITSDSVQLRTLFIRKYVPSIAKLVALSIAAKVLLLGLESTSKQSYLKAKKEYGPEEVTGIFGRSVFWWLNSLFLLGRQKILSPADMFPLNHDLRAQLLQKRMQESWQSKTHILSVVT